MFETNTSILSREEIIVPKKWDVIIFNDDKTSFDFVIDLLKDMFGKTHDDAEMLSFKIHMEGHAIVASYPKGIAVEKARRAIIKARENGYPLLVIAKRGS